MASNQELQEKITNTSSKLGITPDTSGNNAQLAARLKELEEKAAREDSNATNLDNSNVTTQTDPNADNPVANVAPATNTGGIPDADNVSANVQDGILPDPNLEAGTGQRFTVAKGKSITTRRGILGDEASIESRDFYNQESFDAALERGDVVEVK